MALAARAGHILHLPDPLYWQTRGRAGQITATDSDRIFDQFAVLDSLRALMEGPALPGGAAAFAGLVVRLLAERAPVLHDADRRARWLVAARGFLARHGLAPQGVAPASASLAVALEGGAALSLVLAVPGPGPLADSLAALAAQDIATLDIVLTGPGATALAGALRAACPGRMVQAVDGSGGLWADWAAGAAVAQGRALVFWQAGDGAEPIALRHWADALLGQGADLAVSAFRAPFDGAYRDGWADRAAVGGPVPGQRLAPPGTGVQPFHPLAMARACTPALARALLADPVALDAACPLDGVVAAGRLAAAAPAAVWVDFPGAWPAARARPDPAALVAAVPPGPRAERRRAATRALRAALDLGPPARGLAGWLALLRWLWAGRRALARAGLAAGPGPLDPAITPRLARVWGLG
jgi:hypothetical protein